MSSNVRESHCLLTLQDVALLLSCSPRHVERLISSGRFPKPIRVGNARRWRRVEDVEAWIAKQVEEAGG